MRPARFALLFSSLLLSVPVWAQQPSSVQTPEQASQAAAVIQKSLIVQNGGAPVIDVTLTGSVTVTHGSTSESGTIVLTALATGQTKGVLILPSGTRTSFRDYSVTPHVGTSIGPDGISKDAAPQDLTAPHPAWYFPQLIMASALSSSSYASADMGQETRQELTVQHLAIWEKHGNSTLMPTRALQKFGQQDLYLDPATLLPIALTFNLIGTNPNKQVTPFRNVPIFAPKEIRFSDYRQVQGRSVAFHIQEYIHNTLIMEIQFSSVSVNTGAVAAGI